MNKNWLELIEKKYDEIINVGEKAYKDALENQHLRFIVEMDENGNVYSWYDVAGGNSFHASTYNGESIELFEFCMKRWGQCTCLGGNNYAISINVILLRDDTNIDGLKNTIIHELLHTCPNCMKH